MANKDKRSNTNPAKRKSRHIGLIISVVIIAVLAYLVFVYGSLPYMLLTAKQLNASTLQSIMLSKISSAKTFNLSYNGSVVLNGSDPFINFFYNKSFYYNNNTNKISTNTYLSLSITHTNGNYGKITAQLVNLSSSGIVCTTYYNKIYQTSPSPTCVYEKPYAPIIGFADEIANLSTLGNVSTNSYGLQMYLSQPCYSMDGTATIMFNGTVVGSSGFIPATLYFNTCISAQYNIPLKLNGYAKMSSGQVVDFNFTMGGSSYYAFYQGLFSQPP
jgi:hypothetical protein